ncbi:hypothetical protein [Sphingobacterium kitahiroshimense]|uniref:hypothetical protein n=1 Tax=Sphingobacterium kitahiroshimense TaxID=470446 RepID=UPI00320AA9C3
MENSAIFDSYHKNGLQLRNRIVMAPITRSRSDNPESKATDLTHFITNSVLLPD